MMIFTLWKQLRRRLRRSRKPQWTLGSVALLLLLSTFAVGSAGAESVAVAAASAQEQPSISEFLNKRSADVPVTLRRVFVCGEENKRLGHIAPKKVIQMLSDHPEWGASLESDYETILIVHHIEDLSEYCKMHAYFGIDKNSNFSLFDGVPQEEKVMRTFFQLNIHYMESSLPRHQLEQLNKGIRVNDIDEYNSVLSTFSDFAVERNEKTRKQTY